MLNISTIPTPAMVLEQQKFGYLFVGFITATTLYGVILSQVRSSP
jgi:hypothetical protein